MVVKKDQKIKHGLVFEILSIILVSLVSFGSNLSKLGFYLDDWAFFFPHRINGAFNDDGLYSFLLSENRPSSYWFYNISFLTIGYDPLLWHILIFCLRFVAVILFWRIATLLLRSKFDSLTLTLIFASLPVFKQQSIAIAFSLHWISLFLFLLSIYFTVLCLKGRIRKWISIPVAIISAFASYYLVEYFVPLELIRLLIIIGMRYKKQQKPLVLIKKWILSYLPYLGILPLFIYWRMRLMPIIDGDRNYPQFYYWKKAPLESLLKIIQYFFADLKKILVDDIFNMNLIKNISYEQNDIWIIPIIILVGICLFWIFRRINIQDKESSSLLQKPIFFSFLGLLLTFVGFLPGYAINRYYAENTFYSDRFALGGYIGISILIVVIGINLLRKTTLQSIFFAVLISSFCLSNYQQTQPYVQTTIRMNDFVNQLSWRAPYIIPKTAIYSEGELFGYMGSWPTSIMVNSLYVNSSREHLNMDYWFFDWDEGIPDHLSENELFRDHSGISFSGSGNDAIVIDYSPNNQKCLWILTGDDNQNPYLSELEIELSEYSDVSRISNNQTEALPNDIFEFNESNSWCYLFQKAELASQYSDWQTVISLWNTYSSQEKSGINARELLPFVKAAYYANDPDLLNELLTLQVDNEIGHRFLENWLTSISD